MAELRQVKMGDVDPNMGDSRPLSLADIVYMTFASLFAPGPCP